MPTQNISHSSPDKGTNNGSSEKQTASSADKPSARAAEGVSKIADGAQEIAGAATSVAADKARQIGDQVDATVSHTQAKASSLTHEAGEAAKHAAGRVESTARDAIAGAKGLVVEAKEEATELLHDAREVAVESYESAREFALDAVDEASETAQRTAKNAVSFVRRASRATGAFVSLHALPLAATGASLGWLLLSMSKTRSPRTSRPRRATGVEVRRPQPDEFATARPTQLEVEVTHRASRAAPTTTGSKLMGVRVPDDRYGVTTPTTSQRPTRP